MNKFIHKTQQQKVLVIAYVVKRTSEQDVCLFLYTCVEAMLKTEKEVE